MASIFDYLQWRCDVPFSVDPFNEVDNLVLSELAYTDFKGILSMEGPDVSLAEVCKAFFERHTHEEILADKSFTARAPLLMESMLEGARYRDIRMLQYLDETDSAQGLQLAAMTFLLPDDSAYVAFRGTDSTVVGWKEDFYFSFLPETEGQRRAIRYLNQVGAEVKGTLRVGGHSKGGNLAVYAASCCEPGLQERLTAVYSNDGPGFRQELQRPRAGPAGRSLDGRREGQETVPGVLAGRDVRCVGREFDADGRLVRDDAAGVRFDERGELGALAAGRTVATAGSEGKGDE